MTKCGRTESPRACLSQGCDTAPDGRTPQVCCAWEPEELVPEPSLAVSLSWGGAEGEHRQGFCGGKGSVGSLGKAGSSEAGVGC